MPPIAINEDDKSTSKFSALRNAAKISHLVLEKTIGPATASAIDRSNQSGEIQEQDDASIKQTSKLNVDHSTTTPSTISNKSSSKWTTDTWRPVFDNEISTLSNKSQYNVEQIQIIRFKLAQNSAEKQRQRHVREKMADRQRKLHEFNVLMEQMKEHSIQQANEMARKQNADRDEQLAAVMRDIELNERQISQQAEQELAEQKRKSNERMERLRREEEKRAHYRSMKSLKMLFLQVFEKYVKTILTNQSELDQFGEYARQKDWFLSRYEQILTIVNGGQLTGTEVSAMEQLCDDIKIGQQNVEAEIDRNVEELRRSIKSKEEARQQQQQKELQEQQQQQQQQQHQQFSNDFVDNVPNSTETLKIAVLGQCIDPQRLQHYESVMQFCAEYENELKEFEAADNLSSFRFNCKKAVNIPLNSISAQSPGHLQDKFDRVALVLFGSPVKINVGQFTSADHPLGVKYCKKLVAKRFVKLAEADVSEKAFGTFSIAAILVSIWQKFPEVGQLFLAYLYRECPYLVPYFIPHIEGQSTEQYSRLIGYRFTESNVCEEQSLFLKRITGYCRLYSSIMITKLRRGQGDNHPYGIENAWIWLTNILNLEPLAEICATLIYEFLTIVGAEMWTYYGNQFTKLLITLQQNYMKKLSEVDTGGPRYRLEVLLENIAKDGRLNSPQGVLPANFW